VTDPAAGATLAVRRTLAGAEPVERAANEVRLALTERLREAGIAAAGE
jgi:hypothetical protein